MVKLVLKEFAPTDDEVTQAIEVLRACTEPAKKSKMSSMVQHVKGSKMSQEDKQSILDARGEVRQKYLRQYVAYTVAKSAGRTVATAEHSSKKKEKVGVYHWNYFQMCQNVGKDCADEWVKTLTSRADPISKKDTEALRQYIVPVDWFETCKADVETLGLSGEKKRDKEEPIQLFF